MPKLRQMHETALNLRVNARAAELPGYAKVMLEAADDLERWAAEMELLRSAKLSTAH